MADSERDDTAPTEKVEPIATRTAQLPVIADAPPVKRKRRGGVALFSILVVAALLVAAYFVAETYARQTATAYVRDRVIQVLSLPKKTHVDVNLGGGSIIFQALAGTVNDVTVGIPKIGVGELSGSAKLTAHGVPLDSNKPVDKLSIALTVPAKNVSALSDYFSSAGLNKVTLDGKQIHIATEFKVFSLAVPVGVGLEPSAKDGQLVFTPADIELNGQKISVKDLRNGVFGGLAADLLKSRSFCVASFLPRALTLDSVEVKNKTLVVTINGDGAALGGAGLSTKGTCPGS